MKFNRPIADESPKEPEAPAENRIQWTHTFSANTRVGWRQSVGMKLRILADWLDNRTSLAVEMKCSPSDISQEDKYGCLRMGLVHAHELYKTQIELKADELMLICEKPELFSDTSAEGVETVNGFLDKGADHGPQQNP